MGVMEPKTLVFDIDGTLVQTGARIDYENARTFESHCRPYLDAWRRIRVALAHGHRIVFLTARGPHLMGVTHAQVLKWGGSDVFAHSDIILRSRKDFDWAAYVSDKADWLDELRADLYVGDRDEDQTAAAMSGVCFLRAEAWRAGVPWEPVLAAAPGSDERIAAASTTKRAIELGVMPALQRLFGVGLPRNVVGIAGAQQTEGAATVGNVVDSAGGKA